MATSKSLLKKSLNDKDKLLLEKLKVFLLFNSDKENILFLKSLFKDNDGVFETLYFSVTPMPTHFLINIIKKALPSSHKRIVVYCFETPKIDLKLIDFDITFIDIEQIFLSAINTNVEFAPKVNYKLSMLTKKQLLRSFFERKRIFGYLLTALFLSLFSFLTPYKLYYLCFSSVLLVFSLVIFFNKAK